MEAKGRVLITGSRGLVGTPLSPALVRAGYEVVPYDVQDGCDIFNAALLAERMEGVNAVVHLAAIPAPRPNNTWDEFWTLNCLGTYVVARAAHVAGVQRFIFMSSTSYYGFEDGIPVSCYVQEEDEHLSQYVTSDLVDAYFGKASLPSVSYMQSKVIAENILAVYGFKKLMQVVVLRLCPVRGTPYLGLNVYNENVTPAIVKLVEHPGPLWFEIFNFANPDVDKVVTLKWDTFWEDEWQYC